MSIRIVTGSGDATNDESPTSIGVIVGGNWLAQITEVELSFVGPDSMLRRTSSFFGRRDENRECKSARMYHSLRADRFHCFRKKDTIFLRNSRKDRTANSIPGGCVRRPCRGKEGRGGAYHNSKTTEAVYSTRSASVKNSRFGPCATRLSAQIER